MRVVWSLKNSASNFQTHGVRFPDAATVLDDPFALAVEEERHSEHRFVTLGSDLVGTLLVVVYCYTEDGDIRLISARRATRAERRHYENEDC